MIIMENEKKKEISLLNLVLIIEISKSIVF